MQTSTEAQSAKSLTPREVQLLKLATQGYTDKEMAVLLGIRRDTVSTYWKRLKDKYGATSRTGLVVSLLNSLGDETKIESRAARNDSDLPPPPLVNPRPDYSHLTSVLGLFPSAIRFDDMEGRIVYVNDEFLSLLGFAALPGSPIGQTFDLAMREAPEFFTNLAKLLEWEREAIYRQQKITGHVVERDDRRTIEVDYVPVRGEDVTVGHLWIYREIVSLEKEERSAPVLPDWEDLFDNHTNTKIVTGPGNRFAYVNPAAERLLNIRGPEARGKELPQVHAAFRTPWLNQLVHASNTSEPKVGEGRLQGLDGWFEVKVWEWPDGKLIKIHDKTDDHQRVRSLLEYVRLCQITASIAPSLIGAPDDSLKEILRELLGSLGRYLRGDKAGIFTVTPGAGDAKPIVTWRRGISAPPITLSLTRHTRSGERWRHLLERPVPTIVRVDDPREERCENARRFREAGVAEVILIPVTVGEATVGYVQFESVEGFRALGDRTGAILATVAECIAGSFRRLGLIENWNL